MIATPHGPSGPRESVCRSSSSSRRRIAKPAAIALPAHPLSLLRTEGADGDDPVPHGTVQELGGALLAVLWAAMMLLWMGGLALGLWWVWPHIRPMAVTVDFVFSLVWLTTGTTAWLVALNLGYQRFRRRQP